MEILSLVVLLFIPVITVSASSDKNSYEYKNNCRKCKAGYYAIRKCNDRHDTVCAPCPKGSYTTTKNWATSCSICSSCGPGLFKLKPCSSTHDVFCESCGIHTYTHTKSYKKFCLGNKQRDLMFADEALLINEKDKSSIHLQDEGSGDKETDIQIDHNIISYLDNTTSEKNDTEDSGSGDITIVVEPDTEFLTPNPEPVSENITTENVTKNTDTGIMLPDKIKVTSSTTLTSSTASPSPSTLVTTRPSPSSTSTTTQISTKAPVGVSPKSSISSSMKTTAIPTTSDRKTTTTTITITSSTPPPSTKTTTKTAEGVIDVEDSGIILGSENKNHSLSDKIIYFSEETSTEKTGDKDVKPSVNPAVAAQKEEMSGGTDSVTIGVVVAIAIIAAIIFFILGFLVSKYCKRRRRRSFQVMKRVDGNGAAHNGGIPVDIAYRDPDNTGIYDEIGKEPNGHCDPSNTVIVPERADNIYAVIDKSKKRPKSPKMDEELNRIKYIDETTDEEFEHREADRLLETELNEPPEVPKQNGSLRQSKDLETVNEESESTPMLENEETNDSNEEKQDSDSENPVV